MVSTLTAFAETYSCQTTDLRCGISTIDLGSIQKGQMVVTFDEGDDSYEEVAGVPGVDRDCSDKSTLGLCIRTESEKRLLISQEDGVQGVKILLNKLTLSLQYEQTTLVPPFKVQIREKMCRFSCVKN